MMPTLNSPRIRLFALVAIAALATSPVAARRHGTQTPSTGLAGIAFDRAPPDVTFDTGDGPRPLHTRFGRPLVLNFWASWCGPCVAELDQFAQARATYGDRVSIVTISSEPAGVAAAFLAARDLPLPVVDDSGKRLSRAYGVAAVPVTLVLRADGTLAHVSVGELDPGELATALAAVVAASAADANAAATPAAKETPQGIP